MRLRLASRVGISYGVTIVTLLLVLGCLVFSYQITRREAQRIRDSIAPSVEAANQLLLALEAMDNAEYQLIAHPRTQGPALMRFDGDESEFRGALQKAEATAPDPEEKDTLAKVSERFGVFLQLDREIRRLVAGGRVAEAQALDLTGSIQAADGLREQARRYRELNMTEIRGAEDAGEAAQAEAQAFAGAIALIGVVLATFLWRREALMLMEPLRHLQTAIQEVAAGRFTAAHHPAAAATTELGALEAGFNEMAARLQQTTDRLNGANAELEVRVEARTLALKEANRRLEAMVEELRGLDRMKSDLMAVVSHELLTPINFVLAYASTLEEGILGELNPEQSRASHSIVEGAERLTRMVRNILDFTKLESGRLGIKLETCDFAGVVRDVVASLRSVAEAKQQALELGLEEGPLWVRADPARTAQALYEILDNALKFTSERGKISVEVRREGSRVLTEVADTGIGISPEVQARVEQGFYQADLSSTRAYGGIGLGLAIAHHLIRAMDGELELTSELGRGTRVSFTLPRVEVPAA